jgi:hypothetical protein
VVHHYDERLLPIARDRTAALRAGFVAGRSNFGDVIDALKMEKDLELERAEALSEAWTERAPSRWPRAARPASRRRRDAAPSSSSGTRPAAGPRPQPHPRPAKRRPSSTRARCIRPCGCPRRGSARSAG